MWLSSQVYLDKRKENRYTNLSDWVAEARGVCNRGSPCGGSLFYSPGGDIRGKAFLILIINKFNC